MAKIKLKQLVHDIKEAYVTASGDTEPITYGNISDKIANMSGGDSLFSATALGYKAKSESILDIMSATATAIKEEN